LPKTQTRSLSGGIKSKNGAMSAKYRYSDSANGYASSIATLKGVVLQKSGEVRGSYNIGNGNSGRIQLTPNYDGLVAPVNIISPRSRTIASQGGSYQIYITSSELWEAVVSYDSLPFASSGDWVNLSTDSGSGDGVITVEIARNTNLYPRSAKITIAGLTHTIRQNQAIYGETGVGTGGGGSDVTIDPVSRVVDTFSTSYSVTVTGYDEANSANPAADFTSPVSWASVTYTPGQPLEDGTPQGTATVFVDYNPFIFNRTTQLTIGGVPHTLTQLWYSL
jgi:hypothetical protein